ncbi:extracellular solute-binding protein [Agrobacterium sp. LAD9]|uniref:extracellular solute-binding protein n=1 Tax=Agrobacterium sp. LAD9 TaxID=2055153 RepID=UPI00186506EB|nr:extracellular solute-binding protein [Agrobacterium sp. LAD9]
MMKLVAGGAGLLAAPAIVKDAFASSGSLNYMGWAGYDASGIFEAFKKATGITVALTENPDQDAMFAQSKLAVPTGSADIAEPTFDRFRSWASNGLIDPWNLDKLSLSNYIDGMPGAKPGDESEIDGKHYFVPSVWGTEGLIFSKDAAPLTYGEASLADLFDEKYTGQVAVRAHSALAAMGRVLETQGKLPKPFRDSYRDEATMREVWDVVLAEALKHKSNIAQFWASENDAQGAFRTNGCTIGLGWDSTAVNLSGDNFGFIAPKEGAFAWCQGFLLMKNAKNIDQAHEWAKWMSSPEGAAAWASLYKSNSAAKGAVDHVDQSVRDFYAAAYPADAASKLWWWPTQDAWFVKLRSEYADKFKAA